MIWMILYYRQMGSGLSQAADVNASQRERMEPNGYGSNRADDSMHAEFNPPVGGRDHHQVADDNGRNVLQRQRENVQGSNSHRTENSLHPSNVWRNPRQAADGSDRNVLQRQRVDGLQCSSNLVDGSPRVNGKTTFREDEPTTYSR